MPPRKRAREDDEESSPPTRPSSPSGTPNASASGSQQPADGTAALDGKSSFDIRWKTATRTPERVLELQMQKWTSLCYGHYKMPPEIVYDKGVVKYKFVCKLHPQKTLLRARTDTSTTNLSNHAKACAPPPPGTAGTITEFAQGANYSQAMFRYLLTVWVTQCHRPFAIVEDEPLQRILKMLYAKVDIPSAVTVSRDVKEVFFLPKDKVAHYLQGQRSAIHVMFDGWTSPNVISFLGVVICFEEKGELRSLLLDYVRLRQGHTGEYLAERLSECLESFGISHKIYGQTADNASNNDTMITALETLLPGPAGQHTRIRCMCHILNLVVKAVLRPFTKPRTKKDREAAGLTVVQHEDDEEDEDDGAGAFLSEDGGDEDAAAANEESDDEDEDTEESEDSEYELDLDQAASDATVLDKLDKAARKRFAINDNDRQLGRTTLSKLHALTKRIFHSPTLGDDLAELCEKANIKPLKVVRSVPTRWNSVGMEVKRAVYLQPALDVLVSLDRHNPRRGKKLKVLKLTKTQWNMLRQLEPILSRFIQATEHMSASKRPLLHHAIVLIDVMENILKTACEDVKLHPLVRYGASLGRDVLNKYYSKTDESIMYRCAILLHPRLKQQYFMREKWLPEWIETAKNVLREEWKRYKPVEAPSQSTASQGDDIFAAAFGSFGPVGGEDPLEDYFNTPPIPSATDPMKYWHVLDDGKNGLARMALDIISAPATSVDVERAFSWGGLTVSKLRHNLSDESTRAATVLGAWSKVPDLVPETEVVEVFRNKSKRAKDARVPVSSQPEVMVIDSD